MVSLIHKKRIGKLVIPVLSIIVGISLLYFQYVIFSPKKEPTSELVDATPTPKLEHTKNVFRAHFHVFTNDIQRTFTDPKYYNQSELVYLNDTSDSTIYVSDSLVTWNDFFETLPMEVTDECLTTGDGDVMCNDGLNSLLVLINGEVFDKPLSQQIKPGDRLLISYGIPDETLLKERIDILNSL